MADTLPPELPGASTRRTFLGAAGATTASVAVAPLLAAAGPAAAQPAAPAAASPGSPIATGDKATDLARETSVDAGQPLTTNEGLKISDNQNTLRAGVRGPSLLEDQLFRQKMTAFDHERIPERVVHARGAAAHGYFQLYESQARLSKAHVLNDTRARTPVFVRFSTVAGSRGSADTARDVRGFAVKFYTDEGNWDLVGNNIPVFFIQDAIKFPDLILVNAQGTSRFVKFHWKPLAGVHGLVWDEANKLGGRDPDFHRRDLAEAIEAGNFPEWELGIQIVEEADATRFGFDILDATKLIPEELVPVRPIGKMTLNRNPANYFAETEQVAFHTGNLVPGIDVSDDPLLQGRQFSYVDTQLTRLGGPNFAEIPINRPICPFHNLQRDGFHRQTIASGRVNYEPSSIDAPPIKEVRPEQGGFASFPEPVAGPKLRQRSETFADQYSQATLFYRSQTPVEQQHIVEALRFELGRVTVPAVRLRVLANLVNVDRDMASRVATVLGVAVPPASPRVGQKSYPPSPALSMVARPNPKTVVGRKVAILAADGVDGASLQQMKAALMTAGAKVKVLAPHLGSLRGASGDPVTVDDLIVTMPSVVFDAVYVPGGAQGIATLKASGDAVYFVREAYKHLKPISAQGEGVDFLATAGVLAPGATVPGISTSTAAAAPQLASAFLGDIAAHRHWARDKDAMAA